jgi:hypothetical protein
MSVNNMGNNNWTLDLTAVKYSPTYRTSRGSIAQMIVNLLDMSKRIQSNVNTNKEMSERMISGMTKLLNAYTSYCSSVDKSCIEYVSLELMGPYRDGVLERPLKFEYSIYEFLSYGKCLHLLSKRVEYVRKRLFKKSTDLGKMSDSEKSLSDFLDSFVVSLQAESSEWKTFVLEHRLKNPQQTSTSNDFKKVDTRSKFNNGISRRTPYQSRDSNQNNHRTRKVYNKVE